MTRIEWTDETWNPVTGCTPISAGCQNCYARRMAHRLHAMGLPQYRNEFEVKCYESQLDAPMHWRKPRRVFACSMGDLFHYGVSFDFIDRVFAVMALCPQHEFQLLTKRPSRMAEYLDYAVRCDNLEEEIAGRVGWEGKWPKPTEGDWPLPNVWLGTSVENEAVNERIPHLLRCPAAVRFLSCEPLLGPVDLRPYLSASPGVRVCWNCNYFTNRDERQCPNGCGELEEDRCLNWVIVGGETGPGARPMDPAWARDIRDQCQQAGVPFFFKGHGGRANSRLLDGREWNEMPEVTR